MPISSAPVLAGSGNCTSLLLAVRDIGGVVTNLTSTSHSLTAHSWLREATQDEFLEV